MTITKRVRFEVLRRDNFTCRYCRSVQEELTVDHVVPRALGGSDDPSNLVAACKDCNAGKASASLHDDAVTDIGSDALRWSEAMQAAIDRALVAREAGEAYLNLIDAAWSNSTTGRDVSRFGVPRDLDWETTCLRWRDLGLPVEFIQDAIRVAMAAKKVPPSSKWRYTCGVVWKRLAALQSEALSSLAGQTDAVTGEPIADAPPWDLFLQGFRVGRRDAQDYPAYLMSRLSAVIDGSDVWTGAPL